MARRRRGTGSRGGAVVRKSRITSIVPSPNTVPVETVVSPSESEESCGSSSATLTPQQSTTTAIHKKFGKFRCLHLDENMKNEISGSDSEVAIEVVGIVDPNQSSESELCDKIDEQQMFVPELGQEMIVEEGVIVEETVNHCDIEESLRKITVTDYCEVTETVIEDYGALQNILTDETVQNTEEIVTLQEKNTVENVEPTIFEEDSIINEEPPEPSETLTTETDSPCSETVLSSTDTTSDSINSAEGPASKTPTNNTSNNENSELPTENVRRSNRIKTISELKLKSKGPKGRGVVQTKAMLKQGMSTVPLPTIPSPPVKVKQRWRRSSELEAAREDPEMEQRLRQFTHLKENLYLTERLTSKEAKRMTCDCFLTKEEIERGEYGCGEDCLNRLLMIEW